MKKKEQRNTKEENDQGRKTKPKGKYLQIARAHGLHMSVRI